MVKDSNIRVIVTITKDNYAKLMKQCEKLNMKKSKYINSLLEKIK